MPGCTYCDPEIGSVGLTENEAKERGYDVRSGRSSSASSAARKMAGETEGFVKIVCDKKYDEMLGVHMIGPRSTELVAEATLALRLECTVEELIRTIHAHPTMSEAVGEAPTLPTGRRSMHRSSSCQLVMLASAVMEAEAGSWKLEADRSYVKC